LPALKGLKRSAAASTRHASHSHLVVSAFEAAVCPPYPPRQLRPALRPGTQATAICYYRRSRLPFARPQRPKTLRGSFAGHSPLLLSLPGLKCLKSSAAAWTRPQSPQTLRGSFDQALRPQLSAIDYRRSRLPFACLQRPKTLRGSFDQACRPQPSATIGVRSCRLAGLKGLKPSAAASRHSRHSHLLSSATIGVRGCR